MKKLFIVILWLCAGLSMADIPKKTSPPVTMFSHGGGYTYTSAEAACTASCIDGIVRPNGYSSCVIISVNMEQRHCVVRITTNTDYFYSTHIGFDWKVIPGDAGCPENSDSKEGSDMCVCRSGFVENEAKTQCVNSKCGDLKDKLDFFSLPGKVMPGNQFCADKGCYAKTSDTMIMFKDKATSKWVTKGEGTYTGEECTPTESDAENKPTDCKTVEGTVNGVKVCAPPGDRNVVQSVKKTNSETSDKKTTTTTTTTCDGDNCTTETETTEVDKTTNEEKTTKTDPEKKDKDSFCKENPRSVVCKESKFSGACSGGYKCDGDAIQCAIAQEMHRRNCQLFEPEKEESIYTKALAGQDEANPEKLKIEAKVGAVDVGTLDFQGKGWNRRCPQDPKFPMPWASGTEVVLPWSKMCGPLGIMADLAVLISALGCVVWVVGGRE